MTTSRRVFLKNTIIAGAGASLPALPALAASTHSKSATSEIHPQSAATGVQGPVEFTRGIGVYPGLPSECFAPEFVIDATTYRNLALHRPAYHSSSYNYCLTAQLVTDGIKDTKVPTWVSASVSGRGVLSKQEREVLLDHFPADMYAVAGSQFTYQLKLGGGESVPLVDRIAIFVAVPEAVPASAISFSVSISDDGREWQTVGQAKAAEALPTENYPPDLVRGNHLYFPSISLSRASNKRYYQVECSVGGSSPEFAEVHWNIGQVEFYHGTERVQIGGPYDFTSAWMSAGLDEEWVYVDLGARCEFDRVALYWIAPAAEGILQVSDDASTWNNLQPLSNGAGMVDDIKLARPAHGRYLRVLMTRPTSQDGYILSELEVYGRGGPVPTPKAAPALRADGRLDLAGGGWKIQRSSLVSANGEVLSQPGFKDEDWVVATVPGTALTSYFNAGAIPDPNFGENQLYVSDSFFYSDFWYRTEFLAPTVKPGQLAWLKLDGINWKADVFLNGGRIGRIEGGFHRGLFDVTGKLMAGKPNVIALKVEKNATPGSCKQKTLENVGKNGGALGADDPTFHSSIGWDWIPTIRGRNSGIWGDVYLTTTGAVTIESPFVTSKLPLPDTSIAQVSVEAELVNHSAKPVSGTLRGHFGMIAFEQKVVLEGSARKKIKFDSATHPALKIQNPQLWWPVGYGDPHLYDVELTFEAKDKKVHDAQRFKAGVRQFTYSEEGAPLKIYINGRRFVARGGNWGFGESMLRYRAREYDAAVRYHREMNFTMIRDWVGQIGDDALYDACDRHGVVVWQDFWLANPWDGPVPNDDGLFMSNVDDYLRRIRNHASIGLYCGRNEWHPPKVLEQRILKSLAQLHPDIRYISSSADDVVSGHGPYQALPLTTYFRIADPLLHSEIGMPNIMTIESVRATMPEAAVWPQGLSWGLHDFCLNGAQGALSFRSIIDESYGGATNAEEWITLAQFLNYEGYRAMFESQSKYRMGLLLWMSHPCWPSFVWQTYDYFLEPTAAYFGCKKASEPLHIQWNRLTDTIEVVNYNGGNAIGLTARVDILNMNGSSVWSKSASLDSSEDSTATPIRMEYPEGLDPVHFLSMTLSRSGELVSKNIYLRGRDEADYRAIRKLGKARVRTSTRAEQAGELWKLSTQLENTSAYPALMVRLKAVREKSGDRILPVIYEDNYVTLMPGEKLSVKTEVNHMDTRGEKPRMVVEGFNVEAVQ